jgi:hypothetical protein
MTPHSTARLHLSCAAPSLMLRVLPYWVPCYLALLSQHAPFLCTPNLHALLCWLPHVVKQRGAAPHFLEFWVERGVGIAKRDTKYRTTSRPETLIASSDILAGAVRGAEVRYGRQVPSVGALAARLAGGAADGAEPAAAQMLAARVGALRPHSGCLGAATPLSRGALWEEDLAPDRQQVLRALQLNADERWRMAALDGSELCKHSQAALVSGYVVMSTSYTRQHKRDSSHVLIMYETDGGGQDWWAARVRYFLRIKSASEQLGSANLAVCDLYRRVSVPGMDHPDLVDVAVCGRACPNDFGATFEYPGYAVVLETIQCAASMHSMRHEEDGPALQTFLPLTGRSGRRVGAKR